MVEISIISGTDRPNSNALRISRYIQRKYRELNAEAVLIDLQQFPTAKVEGGRYGERIPEVDTFVRPLLESDGLVIVCPEYNGGYPGILKLLIDYLPYPDSLNKKPICFIGEANGAFGAVRAVEQLQQVVGYRNAFVFPERVFISRVNKNFDEENGIKDPFQQSLLESQTKNFLQYINDLQRRELVEE
jgi:NAD(P)H-dependent FMN reductase